MIEVLHGISQRHSFEPFSTTRISDRCNTMVLDPEIETQNDRDWAYAEDAQNSYLQSILDQPFHGQVSIPPRDTALSRANAEYDVLDLTNKLVFWTDASKRDGRVGIAIVWRPQHYSKRWKHKLFYLEKEYRSGHGEFFAIATAIKIAIKMTRERMDHEDSRISSVTVYSDSQEALLRVRDFHMTNESRKNRFDRHVELARLKERAKNLFDLGVPLELVWVKGHRGVEGNVLADKLASRATRGGRDVEVILPTNKSYLNKTTSESAEAVREENFGGKTPKPVAQLRKGSRMNRFLELLKLR